MMSRTESGERLGERAVAFDAHRRKGIDNPDPPRIDAEPREERGNLGIDRDDHVEAAEHESAKREPPRAPACPRGIAAGVEREHDPASGDEGGGKTQSEQTVRELPADVNVNDVSGNPPQQPHHLQRGVRIVDLVLIGTTVPSDVDDRRADAVAAQVLADCDEIRLDAAMRRRVRPELKNHHQIASSSARSRSIGRGANAREASSISRHPIVARVPSRTETGGTDPERIASTNEATSSAYPLSGHQRDCVRRARPRTSRRVKSSVATPMPSQKTSTRSPPEVALPTVQYVRFPIEPSTKRKLATRLFSPIG